MPKPDSTEAVDTGRCVDCEAGRHGACDGTAWHPVTGAPTACVCHDCQALA